MRVYVYGIAYFNTSLNTCFWSWVWSFFEEKGLIFVGVFSILIYNITQLYIICTKCKIFHLKGQNCSCFGASIKYFGSIKAGDITPESSLKYESCILPFITRLFSTTNLFVISCLRQTISPFLKSLIVVIRNTLATNLVTFSVITKLRILFLLIVS